MAKHIYQWDKRSHKPMFVVCALCGYRIPLAEVLEVGCDGCPVEGTQEELFDQRENTGTGEEDSPGVRRLSS